MCNHNGTYFLDYERLEAKKPDIERWVTIICGSTCSGKSTLLNSLICECPTIICIPMYTTREARENESETLVKIVSYSEFKNLLESRQFIYARIKKEVMSGYLYKDVIDLITDKHPVIIQFRYTGVFALIKVLDKIRILHVYANIKDLSYFMSLRRDCNKICLSSININRKRLLQYVADENIRFLEYYNNREIIDRNCLMNILSFIQNS